ncbi:hypothetical protein K0M31_004075 [Melipona bicolor]|uniref:Uncharacterized protein n=1 Tax=Melipona bicolor TaxID=60889 RepID=A0AA40KP38_9HYME|nr:hypothetical protein K0M31_004075 [Melipona bicolor]
MLTSTGYPLYMRRINLWGKLKYQLISTETVTDKSTKRVEPFRYFERSSQSMDLSKEAKYRNFDRIVRNTTVESTRARKIEKQSSSCEAAGFPLGALVKRTSDCKAHGIGESTIDANTS